MRSDKSEPEYISSPRTRFGSKNCLFTHQHLSINCPKTVQEGGRHTTTITRISTANTLHIVLAVIVAAAPLIQHWSAVVAFSNVADNLWVLDTAWSGVGGAGLEDVGGLVGAGWCGGGSRDGIDARWETAAETTLLG